jgi:hypothetical protein
MATITEKRIQKGGATMEIITVTPTTQLEKGKKYRIISLHEDDAHVGAYYKIPDVLYYEEGTVFTSDHGTRYAFRFGLKVLPL